MPYLTLPEAAAVLNRSPREIRALCVSRNMSSRAYYKSDGGHWRIDPDEFRRELHPVAAQPQPEPEPENFRDWLNANFGDRCHT